MKPEKLTGRADDLAVRIARALNARTADLVARADCADRVDRADLTLACTVTDSAFNRCAFADLTLADRALAERALSEALVAEALAAEAVELARAEDLARARNP